MTMGHSDLLPICINDLQKLDRRELPHSESRSVTGTRPASGAGFGHTFQWEDHTLVSYSELHGVQRVVPDRGGALVPGLKETDRHRRAREGRGTCHEACSTPPAVPVRL